MSEEQKAIAPYYCDGTVGGKPLCKLATVSSKHGFKFCKTVHLKGATGREVVDKKRSQRQLWDGEFDVFFVGEASGGQEDDLGIPFVGRAGDILSEFITTAGFNLDRTYVTNLVKCRPPMNRKPAAPEVKACRTHIEYEMRKYKPKVVVLLGNSTLKLFNLDKLGGIGRIHGGLYERTLPGWEDGPTFRVIPTYHPASFLHKDSPKLRKRVLDDYVYAKMCVEAQGDAPIKPYYQCKYKVADTVYQVRQMAKEIKEHGVFSFDTEAPNLKFMTSPMIMCQFSIGTGKTWVVPIYKHDPEGKDWKLKTFYTPNDRDLVENILRELFLDQWLAKIAHNMKHDYKVVWKWLGVQPKGRLWCTQIMKHLINEHPPSALAYLADVEFGTGDWEVEVKKIVGQGQNLIKSYDNIPDEIFWPYAANDAELTYRLWEIYMAEMNTKPHLLKLYYEESEPAIRALARGETAGNYIKMDKLSALDKELDDELEILTAECRKEYKEDFNPASPKQVAELLTSLGLRQEIYLPESASGFSTGKDILLPLADKHPVVGHVLRYRNVRKLKSTYTERILQDLDPDGRLRYSFMIPGTTSGRLSARLLHQIHNIDEERVQKGQIVLRDLFGEEGNRLYFYGDYSQIELRIFAIVAEELGMIKLFEEGKDAHSITAGAALGIPVDRVSKYNRTHLGKRLNFAILYGSGGGDIAGGSYEHPDKLGTFLPLKHGNIEEFICKYKRTYPKIDEYLKLIPDIARSQGCMIQSLFGRERHVPELNGPDSPKRAHAEREIVNFTIQSPAAAITLRTIGLIDMVLEEHEVPYRMLRFANTVHDSFAYGVHPGLLDWFNEVCHTIAERPIPELDNAKFKIEVGWGSSWTEAEQKAA